MNRETYKGFTITRDYVLHDYEYPDLIDIVNAPAGCPACRNGTLPGHTQCGQIPKALQNDSLVYPRLEQRHGWLLEFLGA